MYYRVLVASQRFHGKESLTYLSKEKLEIGQLVRVPMQRQTVVGIVEKPVAKPSFSTKAITEALPICIPNESLSLLLWLSRYYPAPLGITTELFTPPALPKKLVIPVPTKVEPHPTAKTLPPLTSQQTVALETIQKANHGSCLLHGDTGTGKTRVYLELAREALKAGRSVIVLTPEIGLTKPLDTTFEELFGQRVLVTHSEMTPAERRKIWLTLAAATQPYILIGPRSALFAPLRNVGLIVMDEAHDTAYKQEQAPYYQTSRVAAQLAQLHQARFVMGSATPLISDYYLFHKKKLPIIRMTELAAGSDNKKQANETSVDSSVQAHIIDQREKAHFSRSPWLANDLITAVEHALTHDEQSMLFLNRRGSARLVLCQNCGWQALCPHCDVPLTYHQDSYQMLCHSCDYSGSVPHSCPTCGASELIFRSIGTKALVEITQKLFPDARIARFDRDTERTERLQHQYTALLNGEIDIVIGTQAIVKGFDLPKLAVVGVIQADSGLNMPDYNASERTFQLLSQVSGRVGRGHRAGKLFIQTFNPESPIIAEALSKNYAGFYERELAERKAYHFPPFYFVMKVTAVRATSKAAKQAADKVIRSLETHKDLIIEGPSPRYIEKIAGKFAWHVIIKSTRRSALLQAVQSLPANTTFDLDPSDLL